MTTGQVAIVTGGGAGIGKAIAAELASSGVTVVIAARRLPVLAATAAGLGEQTGGKVIPVRADTTDTASVRALAEAAAGHGDLAILMNCAAAPGGVVRDDVADADPDALLADMNTKVIGYFRCAQAVALHMKRHGYGRIVNIGGLTGRASHALSGMRNVAVVHMTKVLSDQLGPFGITVNTLHPGVVETEHIHELYQRIAAGRGTTPAEVEQDFINRTPIRRVLTASEVARAACFLAAPGAGGITGESLGIDGGLSRGIFL